MLMRCGGVRVDGGCDVCVGKRAVRFAGGIYSFRHCALRLIAVVFGGEVVSRGFGEFNVCV